MTAIIKLLEEAQRDAHTAGTSLRLANAEASGVVSLLLLPLIEAARSLEDRICAVKAAMRDDDSKARPVADARAHALRIAVEDVLLGTRADAHGIRHMDGMRDADVATPDAVERWEKVLQDGLDGKAPEVQP